MTSAAIAAFNNARLASQKALFGKPVKIGGVEGIGCFQATRFGKVVTEGGLEVTHEGEVRLIKTEWPGYSTPDQFMPVPVELKFGEVWATFHVEEVVNVELGGEWKLRLRARVE